MIPRPTVLVHDTLDDRREVWAALLRGLTVDERLAFHVWVCDFANLTCPRLVLAAGGASVDLAAMGQTLRAARNGDTLAHVAQVNEIYLDTAQLAHQWGLDYLSCLLELENRAKGREPTPARYAAAAVLAVQQRGKRGHDYRQAPGRGEGRADPAVPLPPARLGDG